MAFEHHPTVVGTTRGCRRARLAWRWIGVLTLAGIVCAPSVQAQKTVHYIHTDVFGSVVAVTDEDGNVIERREYEPYGAQLMPAMQDGPGYTGHVQDAATGLVYMQQRYYDPGIGLFLNVDPVTAYEQPITNFCRYCYARNNPYRFTDPDGRQSESVMDRRYVYPHLNSEQVAGLEARHQELSGQAATGIGLGAGIATLLIPDPTDLLLAGAAGRFAYGLSARRGFSQAQRYIEATASNMRRTGGSSGQRTVELDGRGGSEGAAKLFDRLTGGNSAPRDGGRLGSLGDGSRVHTSTRTLKDGTRETSVRISTERTGSRIRDNIKVRFRE